MTPIQGASMAAGATPACTAITKKGVPCGKTTGTQPTNDGPRCFTHLAKEKRLKDPGSRCPVKNPKTAADVQRIVNWALVRAAEGKLSAPAANSVSSMAKTWLRVNNDEQAQKGEALWNIFVAQGERIDALQSNDDEAKRRTKQLLQIALDD